MPLTKKCTVCKESKSVTEYYKDSRSKDSYSYRCRDCEKKARIKYRKGSRESYLKSVRKNYRKRVYGLNEEAFKEIWLKQGGKCPVCEKELTDELGTKHLPSKAVIDHCHDTGKIRGILCTMCNKGIGLLGDRRETIVKALKYLTN